MDKEEGSRPRQGRREDTVQEVGVGIMGVEDLVEEHEGEEEDEDWCEMRSIIAGSIVSGADEVPTFWVAHSISSALVA